MRILKNADGGSGMDVGMVWYRLCQASVAFKYFLYTEHQSHAVSTFLSNLGTKFEYKYFTISYNNL